METILDGSYYKDVTKEMISFLELKDLLSLSRVNNACNAFLMDECNKKCAIEIRKKFNFMSDSQYQQFQHLLIHYQAVISGSVILQIIYNVIWEYADIDIFCLEDGYEEIIKFIKQCRGDVSMYEYGLYGVLPLKNAKLYINDSSTINVVWNSVFRNDSVKESIFKSFDYQCVMNTWDGEKLEIFNFEDIIHKRITIKNSPVEMYKKINNKRIITSPFNLYVNLRRRLEKYKERGFTCNEPSHIDDFYKPCNPEDLIGYDAYLDDIDVALDLLNEGNTILCV
jgi:hypothetical protein